MSEEATKAEIRLGIGREAVMFTNPVGNGWMGKVIKQGNCWVTLANPRRVAFGLHPGSSDLIGFRTMTITPEMVGQRLAVFAACEVKAPGGKHPVTHEQAHFIEVVQAAGGLAGVARNVAQARHILGLPPT